MTLVVFGHVLTYGLGMYESFISQLFMTFRMPMFFFISGYIAFKSIENWTPDHYRKMLKKKALVQIIPATIFLFLFSFYWAGSDKPLMAYIQQKGLGGYWFTYTLLVYFIIYYTLSLMAHLFLHPQKQDRFFNFGMIIVSLLGIVAYAYIAGVMKSELLNAYAITKVCYYFQFFVFGIMAKKYLVRFEECMNKNVVLSLSLFVFVACLFLLFHPGISKHVPDAIQLFMYYECVRYPGVVLVFALFFHSREIFDCNNAWVSSLLFVGRRTLDIYLIHYFLIPDLRNVGAFLQSDHMFVIQLVFALVVSVCVVFVALIISRVIRLSNFCGYYLFGAK